MHMKGGEEKGLPITPNLKRWTLKIDVREIILVSSNKIKQVALMECCEGTNEVGLILKY